MAGAVLIEGIFSILRFDDPISTASARHGGRYRGRFRQSRQCQASIFPHPPCPIIRPSVPPDAPPNPKPCGLVVALSFCRLSQIGAPCRVASIFSGSTSIACLFSSASTYTSNRVSYCYCAQYRVLDATEPLKPPLPLPLNLHIIASTLPPLAN